MGFKIPQEVKERMKEILDTIHYVLRNKQHRSEEDGIKLGVIPVSCVETGITSYIVCCFEPAGDTDVAATPLFEIASEEELLKNYEPIVPTEDAEEASK